MISFLKKAKSFGQKSEDTLGGQPTYLSFYSGERSA